MTWRFRDAREMLEAAREAGRDAERIRRQLAAMEERALSPGGGGLGARVSGTSDPDRTGRAVAALVDREAALSRRQDEDYALIDAASRVLYGTEGDAGLWSLVGWRADALALHYLNDMSWERVGEVLGYSASHCWNQAQVALEVADGWGMADVVEGRGGAEG